MTGEDAVLMASSGGVELVLSALGNRSSHMSAHETGVSALRTLAMNGTFGESHTRGWVLFMTIRLMSLTSQTRMRC